MGAVVSPNTATSQFLGDLVDISRDFSGTDQTYFVAGAVTEFDSGSGRGNLRWDRYNRSASLSFNKLDLGFARAQSNEFPSTEYDRDPRLPFAIDFASPRTIRLRFATRDLPIERLSNDESIMLDGPPPSDGSWSIAETDTVVTYTGGAGQLRLTKEPWKIELLNTEGELLTETVSLGDPASFTPYVPFSFVRRGRDLGRSTAAALALKHDEMLFGAGESFTRLNKRGQKIVCYLRDAMGAQSRRQYKAVPFFLSSAGYGVFVHTSAPVTLDLGHGFDAHATLYSGDEFLDLFIFLGSPAEILSEYTALTGRSPVPPLWSFGLWMSRITYKSEREVRDVAEELRSHRIPADVIHLDTGWFETDWRNDYEFSSSRFENPSAMIADLREMGFRVSLWQLPYFTSKNRMWDEIVDRGFHVRDAGGALPYLDAVLDFSDPRAVSWYQDRLRSLLGLGVSVIKADFGEDAPIDGLYRSGRTGWFEHNLYPVRYNKAVFEVTEELTGEGILWGRSAWAGSQRYPVHWGGDAENTNSAMAATLRAGLSMGLSGFTYWSHDIGGFVTRAPRDLYRRWTPFGALTSHTRTHGAPPREPWEYDEALVEDFRRAIELKYALMPYVYAQAVDASAKGHPMMRPLFFQYPDDPTSWYVEDQYLFGTDLLVAPLFDESESRSVYLPPGDWIDYQTGVEYAGGAWFTIEPDPVPVVLLVRGGAALPHVAVAQSTDDIDWRRVELRVFGSASPGAEALFALPDGPLHRLRIMSGPSGDAVVNDPLAGRVDWTITHAESR